MTFHYVSSRAYPSGVHEITYRALGVMANHTRESIEEQFKKKIERMYGKFDGHIEIQYDKSNVGCNVIWTYLSKSVKGESR